MCLYNEYLKNPKYKPNKKNGGIVPAVLDIRTTYVPIGCGDCIECRKQKARDWAIRLQEDIKKYKNGKFVTLTFSTESIIKLYKEIQLEDELAEWNAIMEGTEIPKKHKGYDLDNAAATLAVRRFVERWRKKYKESVRHWLITELGGNNWEHVHLHGIIYTDEKIQPIWQYGGVSIGRYLEEWDEYKHDQWVGNDTINYCVKYFYKKDEKHTAFKSKVLASNKPGIGDGYITDLIKKINKYKGKETFDKYVTAEGIELPMPMYYRNKIYTEIEREKLWIHKLDKQERYICGIKIKIDTHEGLSNYHYTLKHQQAKTKRLGYGDGKAFKRKAYENDMRSIMQATREASLKNEKITYKDAWAKQREELKKLQRKL